MSRHWRLCVGNLLLFTGLSTSPALSNPFTELFNPAPKEEAAPAAAAPAPVPVKEACLAQPGRSAARGQHWVYHLEGHRKCWFQTAEGAAPVKKQVHRQLVKRRVIAPDEDEIELRNKTVANARAQMLRSAPADDSRSTPPEPEVVDATPLAANGTESFMPAAPVVAEPVYQTTPDRGMPRPVDVEMLLAETPPATETVAASAPLAAPAALSIPDVSEEQWEWMATQAGVALIAVGLVSLLGSLLVGRFLGSRVGAVRRTSSVRDRAEQTA